MTPRDREHSASEIAGPIHAPAPSAGDTAPLRFAAIDVGSNTIRAVIAEYRAGEGIVAIHQSGAQPRLGAGVERTGVMSNTAMDAAIAALREIRDTCQSMGVTHRMAVATSAIRDAANGRAFAGRVERETGFHLEIIDGIREAELVWRAATNTLDVGNEGAVVADIGGGSLELIAGRSHAIAESVSLPLGAVRLTEQFLAQATSGDALAALQRHVDQRLAGALQWNAWRGANIIGSGGSFTTAAAIVSSVTGTSSGGVHGACLTRDELSVLLARLAGMSASERRNVPGLRPERADIIVAGVAVALAVVDAALAQRCCVSAAGLREGLLLEMAERTGLEAKIDMGTRRGEAG